jgi:EcsC protein family
MQNVLRAMPELSPRDLAELARAKETLETPSLAIRLADRLGAPIDALVRRLPDGARQILSNGTRSALETSLDVALRTLAPGPHGGGAAADWLHRTAVVFTGAVGGSAGLAGLVLELPLSTTVMLRSIADHARAQGEDLSLVSTRLECLAVFAYGSRSPADDAAESAYFAVRAALGRAVAQATEYVAARRAAGATAERTAPALVQLLSRIAQRFGVTVAEKAAAQLVPVIGAAGGAAVNALFIDHYQATARAHFAVRRLVREYGEDAVRQAYGTT